MPAKFKSLIVQQFSWSFSDFLSVFLEDHLYAFRRQFKVRCVFSWYLVHVFPQVVFCAIAFAVLSTVIWVMHLAWMQRMGSQSNWLFCLLQDRLLGAWPWHLPNSWAALWLYLHNVWWHWVLWGLGGMVHIKQLQQNLASTKLLT